MEGVEMSDEQRSAINYCVLSVCLSRKNCWDDPSGVWGFSSKTTTVYKWYKRFAEGRQNTSDDERASRPVTTTSFCVANVKDINMFSSALQIAISNFQLESFRRCFVDARIGPIGYVSCFDVNILRKNKRTGQYSSVWCLYVLRWRWRQLLCWAGICLMALFQKQYLKNC